MKSAFRTASFVAQYDVKAGIPTTVAAIVLVVAVISNAASLLSSMLWVYPDSIDYIQLAAGLVDRFDLTNELFLVRTPGYPVFLAVVFWLFGEQSPAVIQVLQHAMAVAASLLTASIAWRLTSQRTAAVLTGVLCACSLQVLAYSNMVLTEAPYTLTLVAVLYALVRYDQSERRRWLILASLMTGLGYLLRPVGLYLVAVCLTAALFCVWRTRGRRLSRLATEVAWAVGPALALAAPWMVLSAVSHRSLQATRCLDYVFYIRPVTFDGLDSSRSAAMRDIHAVLDEAKRQGHLAPDADFRDRATVIQAYQSVRNMPFAESSKVLGRAGRDIMLEHPWRTSFGTLKYAAWMLLSPDPVYRFLPDGSPGMEGKRDPHAVIYDSGTYAFGEGSWEWVLKDHRHYLPLEATPRWATPAWSALVRWFHANVETGSPILGVGDSLFEECMYLCALGGVLSLFQRRRGAWMLVAMVISLHVLISTFFGGPQTRYAVPIKPILWLYASLPPAMVVQALFRRRRIENSSGSAAIARAQSTPA